MKGEKMKKLLWLKKKYKNCQNLKKLSLIHYQNFLNKFINKQKEQ